MTDRIEPALTPDEWAYRLRNDNDHNPFHPRHAGCSYLGDTSETRHELAAMALYGQPFGFTREDVELLSEAAQFTKQGWASHGVKDDESEPALLRLAAKIAALLPPPETR